MTTSTKCQCCDRVMTKHMRERYRHFCTVGCGLTYANCTVDKKHEDFIRGDVQ